MFYIGYPIYSGVKVNYCSYFYLTNLLGYIKEHYWQHPKKDGNLSSEKRRGLCFSGMGSRKKGKCCLLIFSTAVALYRLPWCYWRTEQTPMSPTSWSPRLYTELLPRATTASSSCSSRRGPRPTSRTRREIHHCMGETYLSKRTAKLIAQRQQFIGLLKFDISVKDLVTLCNNALFSLFQPSSLWWRACGSSKITGGAWGQHLHWKQRREDPLAVSPGRSWILIASNCGGLMNMNLYQM